MAELGRLTYHAVPAIPVGPAKHDIPDWLRIEIGILGGRLYFEFSEYQTIVDYLRTDEDEGHDDWIPQTDGAVNPAVNRGGMIGANVIGFVLEWLTMRRKGQDITHTPMGYVCQRRVLTKNHPFFRSPCALPQDVRTQGIERRSSEEERDGSESDDGVSEPDIDWHEDGREEDDGERGGGGQYVAGNYEEV